MGGGRGGYYFRGSTEALDPTFYLPSHFRLVLQFLWLYNFLKTLESFLCICFQIVPYGCNHTLSTSVNQICKFTFFFSPPALAYISLIVAKHFLNLIMSMRLSHNMALKLKVFSFLPNISFSTVCVPEAVEISNPSQTQVSGISAYKLASFLPSPSFF